MTAFTNYSSTSTFSQSTAHVVTSLHGQLKAFSKSTKAKYSFFPLFPYFFRICLTVNVAKFKLHSVQELEQESTCLHKVSFFWLSMPLKQQE